MTIVPPSIEPMNSAAFPLIRTERLLLRQFCDADLPSVFEGLSHPDVIRYYGVNFQTMEAAKEQMEFFAGLERDGTGIWWAICSQDTGEFLGGGGFNNLSKEHRKAEIGFWLLPEHWGKGIMAEAMPLICEHGFNELGLHRIEGFVESENTNCKRALARLGFLHEGTMAECEVKNGRFISLDIYARLSTS